MFEIGDVFLTRCNDEERNTSPGYWNHAAIYCGDTVIESLREEGVVETSFEKWVAGVDRYHGFRYTGAMDARRAAALAAQRHVGKPYRLVSSLFNILGPNRSHSLNCVAVVRLCYKEALGIDPRWRIPDDIASDENFDLIFMSRLLWTP